MHNLWFNSHHSIIIVGEPSLRREFHFMKQDGVSPWSAFPNYVSTINPLLPQTSTPSFAERARFASAKFGKVREPFRVSWFKLREVQLGKRKHLQHILTQIYYRDLEKIDSMLIVLFHQIPEHFESEMAIWSHWDHPLGIIFAWKMAVAAVSFLKSIMFLSKKHFWPDVSFLYRRASRRILCRLQDPKAPNDDASGHWSQRRTSFEVWKLKSCVLISCSWWICF